MSNALIYTTSIKMEYAAKSKESANNSTSKKEYAKNVMKVTLSVMVDAKESTKLQFQTSVASCG